MPENNNLVEKARALVELDMRERFRGVRCQKS